MTPDEALRASLREDVDLCRDVLAHEGPRAQGIPPYWHRRLDAAVQARDPGWVAAVLEAIRGVIAATEDAITAERERIAMLHQVVWSLTELVRRGQAALHDAADLGVEEVTTIPAGPILPSDE